MELFTRTGVSTFLLQGLRNLEWLSDAGHFMTGVLESDHCWSKLPGPTSGRCFVPLALVPDPLGNVWGCCRIMDPSFLQCSFLLQPVTGTSSCTPWRVLHFLPINPLVPELFQKHHTEVSGGNALWSFRSKV